MTNVTYVAMNDAEYDTWYNSCIVSYAKDKQVALNITNDEAMKLSADSFKELLINGLATPDHYIFHVLNEANEKVGYVWYALFEEWGVRNIFLFDIEIIDKFRGHGYGKATMEQLEQQAKDLNADKVSLHVFGQNNIAKSLYESLGFLTTDISMSKAIT